MEVQVREGARVIKSGLRGASHVRGGHPRRRRRVVGPTERREENTCAGELRHRRDEAQDGGGAICLEVRDQRCGAILGNGGERRGERHKVHDRLANVDGAHLPSCVVEKSAVRGVLRLRASEDGIVDVGGRLRHQACRVAHPDHASRHLSLLAFALGHDLAQGLEHTSIGHPSDNLGTGYHRPQVTQQALDACALDGRVIRGQGHGPLHHGLDLGGVVDAQCSGDGLSCHCIHRLLGVRRGLALGSTHRARGLQPAVHKLRVVGALGEADQILDRCGSRRPSRECKARADARRRRRRQHPRGSKFRRWLLCATASAARNLFGCSAPDP
mmetsp:Transcript_142654/g.455928  ORF Transcript_142654/g.455928 Transcript_142654/m.455928 type:complete len:328 (+) Transcript_142654:1115-2098(+)